jgi:hypothetical protein
MRKELIALVSMTLTLTGFSAWRQEIQHQNQGQDC